MAPQSRAARRSEDYFYYTVEIILSILLHLAFLLALTKVSFMDTIEKRDTKVAPIELSFVPAKPAEEVIPIPEPEVEIEKPAPILDQTESIVIKDMPLGNSLDGEKKIVEKVKPIARNLGPNLVGRGKDEGAKPEYKPLKNINVNPSPYASTPGYKVPSTSKNDYADADYRARAKGETYEFGKSGVSDSLRALTSRGTGKGVALQANAESGEGHGLGLPGKGIGSQGGGTVTRAMVDGQTASILGSSQGKIAKNSSATGLIKKHDVITADAPTDVILRGSIDPLIISQRLREHLPQFQYCDQKILNGKLSRDGTKASLIFTIAANGYASSVDVRENLNLGFKSCISQVVRGIAFPKPKGGGIVDVSQTLSFK